MLANPTGFLIGTQLAVIIATTGLDAADRLGQLKQAEDASIDFYSFVRSSYYQMRRAELREAIGLPSVVDSPALDDPEAPPAADASRPAPAPAASRSASRAR
jgi:phospholipid-binding lipoprotein MlaA